MGSVRRVCGGVRRRGQALQHDSGGRQRDSEPKRDGLRNGLDQRQDEREGARADDNANHAGDTARNDDALDALQLRNGELDAQAEEQEGNTERGERLHLDELGDDAQAARADGHAAQQEADERGLPKVGGKDAAHGGGQEHNDEVLDKDDVLLQRHARVL
ncbi:hypothetical protein FGB62_76g064 [Gracilaria domingensis]|nr:hypothetical protein FGB62_76g064 [Gracilaria domingensis]